MGFPLLQRKSGFIVLPKSGGASGNKYTTLVDKNGLIQVIPRKRKSLWSLVPFKLIALFAVLLTVFKALALINVGINDYEAELQALAAGNGFEKAGAFVLQIDPVTMMLYQQGRGLLIF